MFIGRDSELKLLSETISVSGKAVMIYGKRRVGKTSLIKEAFKLSASKCIYYECSKSPLDDNLKNLAAELVEAGVLPKGVLFKSIDDMFTFLGTLSTDIVIAIDEFPYLKYAEDNQYIDSVFQKIIDNDLSNISLIVSGSHISMMQDLLDSNNALYGRFDTIIKLEELDYKEAAAFYPEKNEYDKVAFYSVFGGSPFVNSQLDPNKDIKENIIDTVLNETSSVYLYADKLLLSDLTDRQEVNAGRIFAVLGNGKKSYSETESILKMDKTGNLNKQLAILMEMQLISKRYPINRESDDKKALYETSDKLIRFYYTYVYKNRSKLAILGPEAFYSEYIEPSLTTYISYRFEDICKQYFSLALNKGLYTGIRNIGTYYYDDSKKHTSGEFDIVLEYKDGYEIIEAKYYKNPISPEVISKEIEQIKSIEHINVKRIGFVSVNGFEKEDAAIDQITGVDLYA